jgi:serine/threonine protein kinase
MEPLQADDPRAVGGFELMNRIGVGGMGVVYLGRRLGDTRLAAIKVMRPELVMDDDLQRRFDREVAAARRVESAHVARLLDAGYESGRAYLAVEFVNGPTLREAVKRDGPLDEAALVRLAEGLADALIAIHAAGIVHRDLTPQNVLLTHAGPRVIDFGIVRIEDVTTKTAAGVVVGTPGYVAPERLLTGDSPAAADVFSVGAVLLYAATGRPPFGSGSPMEVHYRAANTPADLAGVPEPLVPLVSACLRPDPAQRPTAVQLRKMALRIAAGSPAAWPATPLGGEHPPELTPTVVTAVPTLASRTVTPEIRRWWPAVVGLAALAAAGGVFAAVHFGGRHGTQGRAATNGGPASGGPLVASPAADPSASAHPTPGMYPVNRTVYSGSGFEIVLTNMTVDADGEVHAALVYRDESDQLLSLACANVTDPTIDKITSKSGAVYRAESSYCSEHPDAIIVLAPGETSASYAVFAPGIDLSQPVAFTWQDGQEMSGTVPDIRL